MTSTWTHSTTRLLGRRFDRRSPVTVGEVAAAYARRGWPLVRGARASAARSPQETRCSCADDQCTRAGDHPLVADWPDGCWMSHATANSDLARSLWDQSPEAPLLAATGASFDCLDVAPHPGRTALLRLERLGVRLGPVLWQPPPHEDLMPPQQGRIVFLVAAGTAERVPATLRWLRFDTVGLGLRARGRGDWLRLPDPTAPPERDGNPTWLREPTSDDACWLPDGGLLLGTLAYACRHAAAGVPYRTPALRSC